tara:strand:- start:690 stop:860 length:171 start_codon:yes stop_codon:yes gene_type:complete
MENLELTKEELDVIKGLVEKERVYLGSLNFGATDKELADLRIIAPLNFKVKQLWKK